MLDRSSKEKKNVNIGLWVLLRHEVRQRKEERLAAKGQSAGSGRRHTGKRLDKKTKREAK